MGLIHKENDQASIIELFPPSTDFWNNGGRESREAKTAHRDPDVRIGRASRSHSGSLPLTSRYELKNILTAHNRTEGSLSPLEVDSNGSTKQPQRTSCQSSGNTIPLFTSLSSRSSPQRSPSSLHHKHLVIRRATTTMPLRDEDSGRPITSLRDDVRSIERTNRADDSISRGLVNTQASRSDISIGAGGQPPRDGAPSREGPECGGQRRRELVSPLLHRRVLALRHRERSQQVVDITFPTAAACTSTRVTSTGLSL